MDRVVELEIPARPEFVAIARMAVGALAGVRPGLAYERIDDLRIVVSEACTSAIEGLDAGSVLRLRCLDGPEVARGPHRGARLGVREHLPDQRT